MRKKIIDVLLIRAHDDGRRSDPEETEDVRRLMRSRIALSRDNHITIGWDDTLPSRDDILDCCFPAWKWGGKPGVHPTRQFSTHYALMNDNPDQPTELNWDPDGRLLEFVALSRVVHPSAISCRYCARLILAENGQWDRIPAIDQPIAYTSNARTFLLSREWNATAELVEKWNELWAHLGKATRRIATALRWREKAAREYSAEGRWPLLITAIESLVKLWDDRVKLGSMDNFMRGMRLLANGVGVAYTEEEAKLAYLIRSSHVHGQPWPIHSITSYRIQSGMPETVVAPPVVDTEGWIPKVMGLYAKTETVLDAALRKAILDESFRRVFLNDWCLAKRLCPGVS